MPNEILPALYSPAVVKLENWQFWKTARQPSI